MTPASPAAPAWNDRDRVALVALMRAQAHCSEWSALATRISECGSAEMLWEREHPRDLFGDSADAQILTQAAADVARWRHAAFRFHTFRDATYPARLRSVAAMPPAVFTQGDQIAEEIGVCVIGTRRPSPRGLWFTRTLAQQLVIDGVSVIAGLARGVDTAAHLAALEAGGRTIAVLGNGFDHIYPRENEGLQAEIATRGMLLTHFLPEYRPTRNSFPARNVVMSALSVANVITDASETSGTRVQARAAIGHGRPVILSASVATTSWGRRLIGQPGVFVADSPDHAADQVRQILASRSAISQLSGQTL